MDDFDYFAWLNLFADRGFDTPRIVDWPGRGWWPLIARLLDDLKEMGFSNHNLHINQVKEKFGGLRFYFDGGWDDDLKFDSPAYKRVAEAEKQSYLTCEQCGEPGKMRAGGWIKTFCDEHANGREPTRFEEQTVTLQ